VEEGIGRRRLNVRGSGYARRRALRVGASGLIAALGLVAITVGHVSHWERGVSRWAPALRDAEEAYSIVSAGLWSVVPAAEAARANAEPRLATLHYQLTGTQFDTLPVHPLILVTIWLFLVGIAILLELSLRSRSWPRMDAVRVASELGVQVAAMLVLLWVIAPILAWRNETGLNSGARTFEIDMPILDAGAAGSSGDRPTLGETERRIRIALAGLRLQPDHVRVAVAEDARTRERLADVLILRAAAESPFDRWSTSWSGARRDTPQLWITATRARDAKTTSFHLQRGLYPPGSAAAASAEAWMEALEASLRTSF
jgi:hypothetical protein